MISIDFYGFDFQELLHCFIGMVLFLVSGVFVLTTYRDPFAEEEVRKAGIALGVTMLYHEFMLKLHFKMTHLSASATEFMCCECPVLRPGHVFHLLKVAPAMKRKAVDTITYLQDAYTSGLA